MPTQEIEREDTGVAETPGTPETIEAEAPVETPQEAAAPRERGTGTLRARGPRPGGPRGRGPRAPRERSEFDQVTIEARRVARVMAGGRRFNFSLTVVLGDKNGRVGVGIGKGADTALAIEKATRDAKRHMITVPRTKSNSIAHDVSAKYASSTVEIIPSEGRGLVAGSAMRTVLELAGVTDVVTKIHTRSKNKLTIARATIEALKNLASPASLAKLGE